MWQSDIYGNYAKHAIKKTKLIYLDDILTFPYLCDALINYNIYASLDDYKALYDGKESPRLLLGTGYAPLRSEFQNPYDRIVKKDAREVLIFTGGADGEHVAIEMIETLK